jgi:RND family efflux transporter MFP subunit
MFRRKTSLIGFIVLALIAMLSGGYYLTSQAQPQIAAQTTTGFTGSVTRGDIVITASGSGTLSSPHEAALSFQQGGVVTAILIALGDKAEANQPLVRLDSADAKSDVAQAEISLRLAELSQSDLANVTPEELATAQASLSSAKADLTDLTASAASQKVIAARETLKSAQAKLAQLEAGPTAASLADVSATLRKAEVAVQEAQTEYDKISWRNDVGTTSQAADLQSATITYESAKAAYAGAWPTQDEIASARAEVATAQADLNDLLEAPDTDAVAAAEAKVTEAQEQLNTLLNGANSKDSQEAELNVAQAQLDLANAQRTLAEMTLVAPIAGTVTALDAEVGATVGTASIVTISDMDQPQILFWVEETDLASVATGNAVKIVFEALPDYTFPGKIVSVDPATVDVDGTTAVQARASIDLSAQPVKLLSGMNAEVEIVAAEARNALLVPVEALHQADSGSYTIAIVGANGAIEERPVEVGIKDLVNAQIISGVTEGEAISLGTAQGAATTGQSTSDAQSGQLPMGGAAGLLSGGGPGGPPPAAPAGGGAQ